MTSRRGGLNGQPRRRNPPSRSDLMVPGSVFYVVSDTAGASRPLFLRPS